MAIAPKYTDAQVLEVIREHGPAQIRDLNNRLVWESRPAVTRLLAQHLIGARKAGGVFTRKHPLEYFVLEGAAREVPAASLAPLGHAGLTRRDKSILSILAERGGATASQLAAASGITTSAVYMRMKHLLEGGFVVEKGKIDTGGRLPSTLYAVKDVGPEVAQALVANGWKPMGQEDEEPVEQEPEGEHAEEPSSPEDREDDEPQDELIALADLAVETAELIEEIESEDFEAIELGDGDEFARRALRLYEGARRLNSLYQEAMAEAVETATDLEGVVEQQRLRIEELETEVAKLSVNAAPGAVFGRVADLFAPAEPKKPEPVIDAPNWRDDKWIKRMPLSTLEDAYQLVVASGERDPDGFMALAISLAARVFPDPMLAVRVIHGIACARRSPQSGEKLNPGADLARKTGAQWTLRVGRGIIAYSVADSGIDIKFVGDRRAKDKGLKGSAALK